MDLCFFFSYLKEDKDSYILLLYYSHLELEMDSFSLFLEACIGVEVYTSCGNSQGMWLFSTGHTRSKIKNMRQEKSLSLRSTVAGKAKN